MKSAAYSLALISSLAVTVASSAVPRQTCPTVAITADGTGVSGWQVGNSNPIAPAGTGTVILTTSGSTGWNFGSGGLGYPSCSTATRWLNIGSSTHPWKPLTWSYTESTTTWETGFGVYLTASATSDYSETSNFIACKALSPSKSIGAPAVQWPLFLLTGSTLPTVSDDTLSNVNISTCVQTKLFIGYDDSGSGW